MGYLVTTQPEMTGAASVFPYSEWLEDRFIFTSEFGDKVNMSYRQGDSLYVPRGTAPIGKHDIRSFKPNASEINCSFTPTNQEQATLAETSLNLLRQGTDHVFDAPTGWGKSVIGGVIACKLGQPTMIVVQKSDLMDSWYAALTQVLKIPPSMIGKVQGKTCDWKGKQFVLGMTQSLMSGDRYPPEMYRHFGLLILDEAHLMAAEQFINVCWRFPARHRLGFSATPKRADGKWRMIESHVGPVLVKGTLVPMSPKILVKKTGWKIPTRPQWIDGELVNAKIPHAPGRMVSVIKAMASNAERNQIITKFSLDAFKAGRYTLIQSELTDHLERLFKLLTKNGIPGNEIGYYVGGMSKTELEFTKKKRVVLGTYKMCSTGTNVPHWDTMVLATPRAEVKQSVGRVLRYVDGKKQPVVLDMVDHDALFNGFYLSRLKQYYSIKSEIITL